jgi:CBS domain-containing protein
MVTKGHEAVLDDKVKVVLDEKGRDVYTVSPEATAAEAVGEMNDRGVGGLVVVRGDRPVGIFTERDVLRRLFGEGPDIQDVPVARLMTEELVVIGQEVTVGEAMAIITSKRCRHLPVLEDGRLAGIVSSGDLTRWVTRRQEIHIRDLTEYIQGTYPV